VRVFLTCWADPSMYLATTFTAQLLSNRGIFVDLVYRRPNLEYDVSGEVDFGGKSRLYPVGSGRSGWRDKIDYAYYIVKIITLAWHDRPDVIIGYNKYGLIASFIMTRLFPKTRLIYHNFDFDVSRLRDISSRFELSAARRADLTIFPTLERAEVYKSVAGLNREPMSVLNCYPLLYPRKKTGELQKILESKSLCFDSLIIRLGSMGPYHGIKSTIRSMVECEGNWGLILGGFASGAYLEELYQLVDELGLRSRVLILPSVSGSLWYDILYSGDLGISLYEPINLSHDHMAGASQKLNGYFVAGIPSIVPNTPDFISFAAQYGTSKVVDVKKPTSIAQAVNTLLCDTDEYTRYCRNVRNAFESEFNFEKQFKPVLEWLELQVI